MKVKSIFDLIPKAVGEKMLHSYITGELKTLLNPTDEVDGTINLHGPDGNVLAKCYDASSAVFIIKSVELAMEFNKIKYATYLFSKIGRFDDAVKDLFESLMKENEDSTEGK